MVIVVGSFPSNLIHSVRNFQFDFFVQENPGFSGFRADHRLRFVAFSFEIFIGGFNATARHEGLAKFQNRQYDFRTEMRRDEAPGLLENPENPGFSWTKKKKNQIKLEVPHRVNQIARGSFLIQNWHCEKRQTELDQQADELRF